MTIHECLKYNGTDITAMMLHKLINGRQRKILFEEPLGSSSDPPMGDLSMLGFIVWILGCDVVVVSSFLGFGFDFFGACVGLWWVWTLILCLGATVVFGGK